MKRKPRVGPPQTPQDRRETWGEGRWRCREMRDGEGTRTSVRGHTRTHARTGKDQGCPSLLQLAAARTSGKDQASKRHFSPSCHEASAERGWATITGLCLQATSGLSQSGFDGGHQLQKLALRVHVAIASLLGVNQLSRYEHFKEAGNLGSPLAADVQTARELIF